MDEYLLVAIVGVAAIVGEIVLSHRREQRDADRQAHTEAVLVDHDARISEIERWRAST